MNNQLTAIISKDDLGYFVSLRDGSKLICFIQATSTDVRYWSTLQAAKSYLRTRALYKNYSIVTA